MHLSKHKNCWSLRCSWSIACRRCSNYILILDLTHGFNGLGKDNIKTRRERSSFGDLVHLISEVSWYYALLYRLFILFTSSRTHPWLSNNLAIAALPQKEASERGVIPSLDIWLMSHPSDNIRSIVCKEWGIQICIHCDAIFYMVKFLKIGIIDTP